MPLNRLFAPQPTISEEELARGLRMYTLQAATAMGFSSLSSGGIMAAFALSLGANNFQIGALAAIPFVMQLLQLPCIALVERIRRRKLIAVTTWSVAQAFWIPIALLPLVFPGQGRTAIYVLLILMAVRAGFGAMTNCSWNSWVRDLIPRETLGSIFAKRLSATTAASAVVGLGGALFLDWWKEQHPTAASDGYAWLLLSGAVLLGLASPVFMARVPEPMMPPPSRNRPTLREMIARPLRDRNFRRLARFLFLWTFSSNLAIPFFAVYMLRRLEMPLTHVMLLTLLSQASNLVLLRLWGPLADRFGSKAVMSMSISIYMILFIGWVFTTMPERHALTMPLLIALHLFMGIATAGVNLTTTTIGMKLAPAGEATAYLVVSSLAINVGTGLGPLVGGPLGDFFGRRTLSLTFGWTDPSQILRWPAFNVMGFDFLFLIAFVLGLVTLFMLTKVREEGEVSHELVMDELWAQTRQQFRTVSSAPRFGLLSEFPAELVRRIPGLEIAIGVTAYQLASVMRATVTAVGHGRRALAVLSSRVAEAITELVDSGADLANFGTELGRHAVRGAIQAANPDERDCGKIAVEAVIGICTGLDKTSASSVDVLYGAGFGAVQGAAEAHADLTQAAVGAVEGARQVASQIGLAEIEAEAAVARGALTAVQTIAPQSVSVLRSEMNQAFPRLQIMNSDN